jgi:hypothetical protein
MRPWQFILACAALLATLDYVVNDGDLVRDVVVWLLRTGQVVAREIHRLVIAFFGE